MLKKKKTVQKLRVRRETIRTIGRIFCYMLVMTLFTALTAIFILGKILVKNDSITSLKGISAQVVISGSMRPTLDVYDVVIIKPQKNYYMGDIITFLIGDGLDQPVSYTHRIEAVGNTYYCTKGDNNNVWDDWFVMKSNVVGKVVYRIPKIGKLVLYFSTIPISIYRNFVCAIWLLFCILLIIAMIKELKREFTPEELRLLAIEDIKDFDRKTQKMIKKLRRRKKIRESLL